MRGTSIAALLLTAASAAPLSSDIHGIVRVAGRPAANAVVWLEAPDAVQPAAHKKVVLDQHNLNFWPRVLVVRVGAIVEFPNNDRVFHNVFSFRDGKKFDLGLYPVGAVKQVAFTQPGLSRIYCNIHPQMAAYVMVVDTPYFDVSGEKGGFTLADVPAGTYTYHAWRAGGSVLDGSIGLAGDKVLDIQWP